MCNSQPWQHWLVVCRLYLDDVWNNHHAIDIQSNKWTRCKDGSPFFAKVSITLKAIMSLTACLFSALYMRACHYVELFVSFLSIRWTATRVCVLHHSPKWSDTFTHLFYHYFFFFYLFCFFSALFYFYTPVVGSSIFSLSLNLMLFCFELLFFLLLCCLPLPLRFIIGILHHLLFGGSFHSFRFCCCCYRYYYIVLVGKKWRERHEMQFELIIVTRLGNCQNWFEY